MARRGLCALAGLAFGLAASSVLAGPARPDVPEGPRSRARTLGNYAPDARAARGERDLPTLGGADPADTEAVAEDKLRRLAQGLMAVAVNGAPEAIDEAAEIVLAPPGKPGRAAGAHGLLAAVVTVQHGPGPGAGRRAAAGGGVTVGAADGAGATIAPQIDPSRYATAAITGPGGLLAVVLGPPDNAEALDTGTRDPMRPVLGRLPAGEATPGPVRARSAEWLRRAAGGVKRLRSYPAYLAFGSMVAAGLAMLLILRRQPRRRKRRH